MKTRCTIIDPKDFAVSEVAKEYYHNWFGAGRAKKVFDDVKIGSDYVVYALKVYAGYPFYFVRRNGPRLDWSLVPAACFEILDSKISRLWHCRIDALNVTLAIKEWVVEEDFFEKLMDGSDREVEIMKRASEAMEAEHAD